MYNDVYQSASALQQLQLRDADEQSRSAEPRMEMWRSRWDAKWVYGGESSTTRGTLVSATERVHSSAIQTSVPDLPRSHWDVVRARIGDIAQW